MDLPCLDVSQRQGAVHDELRRRRSSASQKGESVVNLQTAAEGKDKSAVDRRIEDQLEGSQVP